ncbi:MAG TPA: hypothetical protein VFE17_01900, partial [Candidatus Baltobacteraceae bacterium]|nr:hypothetical protein [Candidatus Baltobacteraceae bacterium]
YIDTALSTETIELQILNVVSPIAIVALTLAVAHGVLRHRVFDVSFVVSRTVVYTVLTSIIVGAFVAIDFVSSKLIEHLQVAAFFEAASALALGVWLNVLHARIDRFVDRVLFRRRHLAEARLERTAKSLMHAESSQFIDEAAVVEPCDALALASAAVFRQDEGQATYSRVFAKGWEQTDASRLSADDHLVVHLRAELQAVHLAEIRWPRADLPAGMGQPLFAVPFVVRHEVLGFAVYGGHCGGEAIDPDEQGTLVRLADAAAAAYEYLRAKDLLDESTSLRAQNDVLVHEQALLREMVDALRGNPRVVQS